MGWEEGEGHGRRGTNFVMTLIIIIIIIIKIIIIIIIITTAMIIINSRFVAFFEQKNSRTYQGLSRTHLPFSRTPFNAQK